MHFNGMQVIVDANALADTKVRNFRESRHRSPRIYKKLIKRFGGLYKKEPAMWRIGNKLVVHPVRYAELKAATAAY